MLAPEVGRGYSADELSQIQTRDVCAELRAKAPGVMLHIENAMRRERDVAAELQKLRLKIQDVAPGDPVNVAFATCRELLEVEKSIATAGPSVDAKVLLARRDALRKMIGDPPQ
jgi:hypothetical protein